MVLFELISGYVTGFISWIGYAGIFLLMTAESACIPIASEITLPFSGFAVQQGNLSFWMVVLAGTFGCLAGSIISYYVGFYGGRPILERYGRYILIQKHDLDRADVWFAKYGNNAVFFSRLLPIVRTFISLPAGIARLEIKRFMLYSFMGSLPWCIALTYAGVVLGNNWGLLDQYGFYVDIVIIIGIIAFIAYAAYVMFIKKDKTVEPTLEAENN